MTRKYKKVRKTVEVLDTINCDICGKSCKIGPNFEYLHIDAAWGYGSHWDGEIWTGDYCQDCSILIKEFIESKNGKINITEGCF